MSEDLRLKIIIAETAPVVMEGFSNCLKKIHDLRTHIFEITTKKKLIETVNNTEIDLLIINPTFGGIFNPEELRKSSLNRDLKVFAIEMGKLSHQILALYDDHLHITDDLAAIGEKVKRLFHSSKGENEEKETLSAREREIVSYVVKGFTNQEIADKLFLSIHTVITHRRNIARKLEIHSATGLTIYAIVNKIVDLSEIKL
ncbi:MAG: response regulator transcription factor [Muribaculaceae bacterium]|nr:response regulator transcription factor [Muribaculaceae bacterium]